MDAEDIYGVNKLLKNLSLAALFPSVAIITTTISVMNKVAP